VCTASGHRNSLFTQYYSVVRCITRCPLRGALGSAGAGALLVGGHRLASIPGAGRLQLLLRCSHGRRPSRAAHAKPRADFRCMLYVPGRCAWGLHLGSWQSLPSHPTSCLCSWPSPATRSHDRHQHENQHERASASQNGTATSTVVATRTTGACATTAASSTAGARRGFGLTATEPWTVAA
jgi:hypothetical protein